MWVAVAAGVAVLATLIAAARYRKRSAPNAEAEERALQSAPAGPLASLFAAGHGVTAAYREVAPAA